MGAGCAELGQSIKLSKRGLSGQETFGYNLVSAQGGIAQLGERLHGMQEVSGSIPLTSTSFKLVSSRGAEQVVQSR